MQTTENIIQTTVPTNNLERELTKQSHFEREIDLSFERYIVNTNILSGSDTSQHFVSFTDEMTLTDIKNYLASSYSETPANSIITDTASHHVYFWDNTQSD